MHLRISRSRPGPPAARKSSLLACSLRGAGPLTGSYYSTCLQTMDPAEDPRIRRLLASLEREHVALAHPLARFSETQRRSQDSSHSSLGGNDHQLSRELPGHAPVHCVNLYLRPASHTDDRRVLVFRSEKNASSGPLDAASTEPADLSGRRVNLSAVATLTDHKKLVFSSHAELQQELGLDLEAGDSVTPLALLDRCDRGLTLPDVIVVIDASLAKHQCLLMHPLRKAFVIGVACDDLLRLLRHVCGCDVIIVDDAVITGTHVAEPLHETGTQAGDADHANGVVRTNEHQDTPTTKRIREQWKAALMRPKTPGGLGGDTSSRPQAGKHTNDHVSIFPDVEPMVDIMSDAIWNEEVWSATLHVLPPLLRSITPALLHEETLAFADVAEAIRRLMGRQTDGQLRLRHTQAPEGEGSGVRPAGSRRDQPAGRANRQAGGEEGWRFKRLCQKLVFTSCRLSRGSVVGLLAACVRWRSRAGPHDIVFSLYSRDVVSLCTQHSIGREELGAGVLLDYMTALIQTPRRIPRAELDLFQLYFADGGSLSDDGTRNKLARFKDMCVGVVTSSLQAFCRSAGNQSVEPPDDQIFIGHEAVHRIIVGLGLGVETIGLALLQEYRASLCLSRHKHRASIEFVDTLMEMTSLHQQAAGQADARADSLAEGGDGTPDDVVVRMTEMMRAAVAGKEPVNPESIVHLLHRLPSDSRQAARLARLDLAVATSFLFRSFDKPRRQLSAAVTLAARFYPWTFLAAAYEGPPVKPAWERQGQRVEIRALQAIVELHEMDRKQTGQAVRTLVTHTHKSEWNMALRFLNDKPLSDTDWSTLDAWPPWNALQLSCFGGTAPSSCSSLANEVVTLSDDVTTIIVDTKEALRVARTVLLRQEKPLSDSRAPRQVDAQTNGQVCWGLDGLKDVAGDGSGEGPNMQSDGGDSDSSDSDGSGSASDDSDSDSDDSDTDSSDSDSDSDTDSSDDSASSDSGCGSSDSDSDDDSCDTGGYRVIGLDAEWPPVASSKRASGPSCHVSLLQIACASHVFLFDLLALVDGHPLHRQTAEQADVHSNADGEPRARRPGSAPATGREQRQAGQMAGPHGEGQTGGDRSAGGGEAASPQGSRAASHPDEEVEDLEAELMDLLACLFRNPACLFVGCRFLQSDLPALHATFPAWRTSVGAPYMYTDVVDMFYSVYRAQPLTPGNSMWGLRAC